jgi:formate/nitrite transporter FocA (FNT family)
MSDNGPAPEDEADTHISAEEQVEARELTRLKSRVVYEIIRQEGESELKRPQSSIWWSGIAAGVGVSLSLMTEAMLRAHLPDAPWRPLVENIGYTSGFLLVMLSRLQLFTENTITTVLPTFANPCRRTMLGTLRLWGIVFVANMIGTFLAAIIFAHGGILPAEVVAAALDLSRDVAGWDAGQTFTRAIPAGFLIAAVVWMMPSSEGSEFWVIFLFTYIIALGEMAHVVVGSVELFLLVVTGEGNAAKLIVVTLLPALCGNILGGTGLFALLAWGQVSTEITDKAP